MELRHRVIVVCLSLLLTACGMAGNWGYRNIEIKSSSIGVQFTPNQITGMLENNGYQRRETSLFVPQYGDMSDDTGVANTGMLIESTVDYRMAFQSDELPGLFVFVRILKRTGNITIGLVQDDSRQLDAAGERKRDELVALLGNLYGPENVKVRR